MNFDNFNSVVEECRAKKPILFGLEHDKILSAEEIVQFERIAQITLPEKYKEFITRYGGGYFGYANIYSLDSESDFYILKHNNLPLEKFIRIADNGCGDYYLFKMDKGKCLEPVYFYDHDADKVTPSEHDDVFEYLIKVGLKKSVVI